MFNLFMLLIASVKCNTQYCSISRIILFYILQILFLELIKALDYAMLNSTSSLVGNNRWVGFPPGLNATHNIVTLPSIERKKYWFMKNYQCYAINEWVSLPDLSNMKIYL